MVGTFNPKYTYPKRGINYFCKDPPEARGDLAYDPFTHNAFGRLIKLGVTYSMEQ